MKRLIAGVLAAAVLCLGAVTGVKAGGPQALDTAAAISFKLVSPQQKDGSYYLCTGFMLGYAVDDTGQMSTLVASAGHCAMAGVTTALIDGRAYEVEWARANSDPGYDSALGIIYGFVPGGQRKAAVDGACINENPAVGTALVSFGYGQGQLQNYADTYLGLAGVVNPDSFPGETWGVMQFDKPVRGGMSGSPVLDTNGCIVGIMVYSLTGTDPFGNPIATDFGGFTPIDVILQ